MDAISLASLLQTLILVYTACSTSGQDVSETNYLFLESRNTTILTSAGNLTSHGLVNVLTSGSHTILELQDGGYLTLPSERCLADSDNCTNGFTVSLTFRSFEMSNKTRSRFYLLDSMNLTGATLFWESQRLTCIWAGSSQVWHLEVQREITANIWHQLQVTWHPLKGLALWSGMEQLSSLVEGLQQRVEGEGSLKLGSEKNDHGTALQISAFSVREDFFGDFLSSFNVLAPSKTEATGQGATHFNTTEQIGTTFNSTENDTGLEATLVHIIRQNITFFNSTDRETTHLYTTSPNTTPSGLKTTPNTTRTETTSSNITGLKTTTFNTAGSRTTPLSRVTQETAQIHGSKLQTTTIDQNKTYLHTTEQKTEPFSTTTQGTYYLPTSKQTTHRITTIFDSTSLTTTTIHLTRTSRQQYTRKNDAGSTMSPANNTTISILKFLKLYKHQTLTTLGLMTTFGDVNLEPVPAGFILKLDEMGEYVDLGNPLPCLTDVISCRDGFNVRITLEFLKVSPGHNVLLSSIDHSRGVSLVYSYDQITFTVKSVRSTWLGFFNITLQPSFWYTLDASWDGVSNGTLYVNNQQLLCRSRHIQQHSPQREGNSLKLAWTLAHKSSTLMKVYQMVFWSKARDAVRQEDLKLPILPTESYVATDRAGLTPTTRSSAIVKLADSAENHTVVIVLGTACALFALTIVIGAVVCYKSRRCTKRQRLSIEQQQQSASFHTPSSDLSRDVVLAARPLSNRGESIWPPFSSGSDDIFY